MKKSIILGLILSMVFTNASAYVCINEVMAKNDSFVEFADSFGELSDWIELYNTGDEPVNLENYYLSDDISEPCMWKFPQVIIEPKSYLIVYASGKDTYINGELHTNFKINEDETIVLTKPDGITTVDIITLPSLEADCSYYRRFDGESPFEAGSVPSFNKPNTQGGLRINVFGKYITPDTAPRIINGTTMLPIRFIFDALGAYVSWDGAAQTITGYFGDTIITLQIGNNTAYVNGEERALAVAPMIFNERTLVPARFIAESFNLTVEYNESTRTVYIKR